MTRKMLINATHPEENRVAIVEEGILTELDIEIAGKEQTKGNIYKATVVRVEQGLQAAFVDYGAERLGFLQVEEVRPSIARNDLPSDEKKGRPRINDILHRGQEILVQIVKEERGTKGAALTTYLSLPGRYMVFMPDSKTRGISRKIEVESQRKKLKEALKSIDLPEDVGCIVRTAAMDQTKEELQRDLSYLQGLYRSILALEKKAKAPALLYKETNLVIRSIRDYFTPDMEEVLVDDPKVFDEARDFFQDVMPEYSRLVKLHQERRPIFSRYQIEEQIQTISNKKVPLPSGGSIVIDETEALVAIDVNSGKMAGEQGIEATATKTNLEAAAEVGRQLRLRDLGGLIVIDFIDMRERKHIREVEKAVKDALKNDKARVTVGRISQFGLLELSRQRIKAVLAEGSFLPCPHCEGTGKIKSPEAQAVAFLRKLQAVIAKGNIGTVTGKIPLDVATYLLNNKRNELHAMEQKHDLSIHISGHPDFISGQLEIDFQKREKERDELPFVTLATAPPPEPIKNIDEEKTEGEPLTEIEPKALTEGEPEEKKKRRRNRRKKKRTEEVAPTEAVETPGEETPDASEGVPETEPPETSTTEPEEGETVKKKRRRRRRRKPTIEAEQVETPTSSEKPAPKTVASTEVKEEPTPQVPAAETEATQTAPGEKTKKKPARRTTKKSEVAVPETAPAMTEEALKETEEKPKKQTPRRTTKKKTEKTTPEPAPEKTAETSKEAEEKPEEKTTRRTTKKKTEVTEPVTTTPKTEEIQKETVEMPKKATTRRTTKKKAEVAAPETTPPKAEEAPKGTEEKPKKATARRTTKKKAEETASETTPAKAEEASKGAEEKPKKATARRTTKKKAEETAPETTPAKAKEATKGSEQKPKKTTVRRTTKKASTKEDTAPKVQEES